MRDKDNAEDIVQDVFLKLWKNKEEVDWNTSMKGYLYRATTNGALNWLEKNRRIVRYDDNISEPSVNVVEQALNASELQEKIKLAIASLPPKCKAIFVLSRYEELKYKQIADQLNLSIKTVENQMGIALEKLRKELKPYLSKTITLAIAILKLCSS